LSRTVLAAACFVLGSALLIPLGLPLWTFVAARLSPPEITYLPEPLVNYVLYLNGRAIGDVTVLAMAAVFGAALLLAGLKIVRWRRV
jgi:predicted cation transporter